MCLRCLCLTMPALIKFQAIVLRVLYKQLNNQLCSQHTIKVSNMIDTPHVLTIGSVSRDPCSSSSCDVCFRQGSSSSTTCTCNSYKNRRGSSNTCAGTGVICRQTANSYTRVNATPHPRTKAKLLLTTVTYN